MGEGVSQKRQNVGWLPLSDGRRGLSTVKVTPYVTGKMFHVQCKKNWVVLQANFAMFELF